MTRARDLSKLSNSQVFSIDSDFQVGINSTVPAATLDVRGNSVITGILTATSFSGTVDATGLTGSPSITVTDITASGNVSVGGTLTYEDVTNIDAVGVITARSDISIADKIIHTGDTNTAIRFPAADTFTVETGGSERVRVTSAGKFGVGLTPSMFFEVLSDENDIARFSGSNSGNIVFRNDTSNEVQIHTGTSDALIFGTNGENERLRIDSSGRLLHGTTSSSSNISAVFQGNSDNSASAAGILLQRGTATPPDGQELGNIYFADSAAGTGAIILGKRDGGTWSGSSKPGRIEFWTTPDGATSGNERLRITSDGIVDVTGKLRIDISSTGTVGSGAAEGIFLRNTNETDNNAVTIFGGADDYSAAASAINFINVDHSANAGAISFDTRTTGNSYGERVRIDSSGKVGINVDNPGSYNSSGNELVLGNTGSNAGMTIVSNSANNGHIFFADGTASGAQNRGIIKYEHGNDAMAFNTAETERVRIHSGGGMSVGATGAPTCLSQETAIRLGTNTLGHHTITNLSTTVTNISAASGLGGLAFVQLYNTSNGAQYVGLHQWRYGHLDTISETNNTGLTLNFSVSTNTLRLATASGTVSGSVITLQAST